MYNSNNQPMSVDAVMKSACEAILLNSVDQNGVYRAYVPLNLVKKPSYQRSLDAARVRRIVQEWDSYKANELCLSFRDGVFYVVDGQHTMEAAIQKGVDSLPAKIYKDLTEESEALIFAMQNKNTRKLSSNETFFALVKANDFDALEIKRVLDAHGVGYEPRKPYKKHNLTGMNEVTVIYRAYGATGLNRVMDVVDSLGWSYSPEAYQSRVLRALSRMVNERPDRYDSVVKKFHGVSPRKVISEAQSRFPSHSRTAALCAFMQEETEKE